MRKSRQETADTRKRILSTAASEFRRNGITGTGLAELMAAAGLTHGGFYRHFDSKEQLVAESFEVAIDSVIEATKAGLGGDTESQGFATLVANYLSEAHRDDIACGCPFSALGGELARTNEETREVATQGFLKLVDVIAGQMGKSRPDVAKTRAIVTLCTMVGAITMARMVADPELSATILKQTERQLARA